MLALLFKPIFPIDLSLNEDKQSPFALSLSKGQQASTGSGRTVS